MKTFKTGDKVSYNNGKAVGTITGFSVLFWSNEKIAFVKGELFTNSIRVAELIPA